MAIKNNDFLKGIGGFGEGFIKTLQSERERKQKELEFNQEMSYKMRQQNLMSQVYLRDDLRQQQTADMNREKTEYDIRSGYQELSPEPNAPLLPLTMGGQAGGELNKPFGGVMNPFDEGKFYAPKPEKQQAGIDLYEDMGVEEIKGKPFDRKRNKQTGKLEYFPRYEKPDKPTSPKEETTKEPKSPDLSNEIDELEYWYREYTSKNDEPSLQNVRAKSEALMSKAGLTGEIDMIWNAYKDGRDYNETIEAINNYRVKSGKPELTDWQIDASRRYYNARVPKAYKK